MIKKYTGRILTVKEFRKLNQCMECRKMLDIKKGSICEDCKKFNRTRCKHCEIVLRNNKEKKNKYYVYNDNDVDREKIVASYSSKKPIKEFIVTSNILYPKYNDEYCIDCFNKIKYIQENYNILNMCASRYCFNKLIDEPTSEKMVNYLKNHGRQCLECRNI